LEESFLSTGVITMMLVELLKKIKIKVDNSYLPLISVAVAAVVDTCTGLAGAGFDVSQFNVISHLITGVSAGLAASGGYDSVTSLFKKKADPEDTEEEQGENI
jgi:uncharacterized membrane protein